MKTLSCIFLLLLLPFFGVAQQAGLKDTVQQAKTFTDQFDLDVHFLGIEASLKSKMSSKLFYGFGFQFGFIPRPNINPIRRRNSVNGFFELARGKGFLDYQFTQRFHSHIALTYSFATVSDDFSSYGTSIGIELGGFYQIWKIELGVAPSLIFFNDEGARGYEQGVLTTSLLIIKIPLKRW